MAQRKSNSSVVGFHSIINGHICNLTDTAVRKKKSIPAQGQITWQLPSEKVCRQSLLSVAYGDFFVKVLIWHGFFSLIRIHLNHHSQLASSLARPANYSQLALARPQGNYNTLLIKADRPKNYVICFIESLLKLMKSVFCFILKSLFVLKTPI